MRSPLAAPRWCAGGPGSDFGSGGGQAAGDRPGRHRAGGAGASGGAAGGVPDRNGLWPWRRRHQRPRRGRDLRRQGAAALQPPDRARDGCRGGARAGALERNGRAARRALLAGRAHPGPAARRGLPAVAAGQRRRRHRGPARPGAPGGPGAARRDRAADRRAERQSGRAGQPDHRRPRRSGPGRQDRPDRRRRPLPDRRRIDGARPHVRAAAPACGPAGSPASSWRAWSARWPVPRCLRRRSGCARRASSPATTRPRARSVSTSPPSSRTRPCSRSGRTLSKARP